MAKRKRSSKERPNGKKVERKRVKRLQLSDLPVDILCNIISRLAIKEAARTSVLSNHWKNVWCSRTNLEFSFRSIMPWCYNLRSWSSSNAKQDFCKIVNGVLKEHSCIGVEKMEVNFGFLNNEHADHIDRWLKFAIMSKAKQLTLNFALWDPSREDIKELYKFPFQLFEGTNSSHLQSMKLGLVSLNNAANFKAFVNLKRLDLVDVSITDEELQVLFSNCNDLECLGLSYCRMLTNIHSSHSSKHFKHLLVSGCPLLKEIELSSGLTTLQYGGPLIPLAPPETLTNVSINSSDICSALAYIYTDFPSTLPRLEMLTLRCEEFERATLMEKHPKFNYLRHLRLEIAFSSTTDIFDFAPLLEAAPFMEKLEFHMWKDCNLMRYRKHHGELRSLPPKPHSHLKLVDITGFYGQKDQLELALHILRNSIMLEAMKIDPKPTVAAVYVELVSRDGYSFIDGYKVAKKYLREADHHGVLNLVKVRRKDVESVSHVSYIVDPVMVQHMADCEANKPLRDRAIKAAEEERQANLVDTVDGTDSLSLE